MPELEESTRGHRVERRRRVVIPVSDAGVANPGASRQEELCSTPAGVRFSCLVRLSTAPVGRRNLSLSSEIKFRGEKYTDELVRRQVFFVSSL